MEPKLMRSRPSADESMCEAIGHPPDEDVACRETAYTKIERIVDALRRRLAGLEGLLKIAKQAESGSPLEECLWEMAQRLRS